MPFGYPESDGGNILPRIKFNAENGMWFRIDRVQEDGEWVSEDSPLPKTFKMKIDVFNMQVGWARYQSGSDRLEVLPYWRENQKLPKKPQGEKDVKPQGRFFVSLPPKLRGPGTEEKEKWEWGTGAKVILESFEEIWDQVADELEDHPDETPVFKVAGTKREKKGQRSFRRPIFELAGWADREWADAEEEDGTSQDADTDDGDWEEETKPKKKAKKGKSAKKKAKPAADDADDGDDDDW